MNGAASDSEARPEKRRLGGLERLALVTALAALLVVAVKVTSRWGVWVVWDDAWMFQRYAAHVLSGHGVVWNPGEAPSYGLTTLLFLVPSIVARAIFQHPTVAVLATSVTFGVAMLAAVGWMIASTGGQRSTRWLAFALFAAAFAASHGPEHFASGMDTTFGAAYLALLLGAAHRFQRTGRHGAGLGILAGLAIWIRPELCLFGAALVATFFFGPRRKKDALALGLGFAATIGLLLLAAKLYFGTALPLPFYAKTGDVYGEGFLRNYRGETTKALGQFIPLIWPLVAPIAIDLALGPQRYVRRMRPVERAVLLATVAFIAFHWLVAVPIMGFAARYFQPAVVPLAYLAAQSLSRLHAHTRAAMRPDGGHVWAGFAVVAALLPWPSIFAPLGQELEGLGNWIRAQHRHDIYRHAQGAPAGYWAKIDQLRSLDSSVVIASTEVGFLGIHQRDKRIIDIAGLNDRRYAFGFDPALLIDHDAPDLLYLPHPHYEAMVRAIEEHPTFHETYLAFTPARVGTRDFGVALRRDSPHFEAMLAIFDPSRRNLPRARPVNGR